MANLNLKGSTFSNTHCINKDFSWNSWKRDTLNVQSRKASHRLNTRTVLAFPQYLELSPIKSLFLYEFPICVLQKCFEHLSV